MPVLHSLKDILPIIVPLQPLWRERGRERIRERRNARGTGKESGIEKEREIRENGNVLL